MLCEYNRLRISPSNLWFIKKTTCLHMYRCVYGYMQFFNMFAHSSWNSSEPKTSSSLVVKRKQIIFDYHKLLIQSTHRELFIGSIRYLLFCHICNCFSQLDKANKNSSLLLCVNKTQSFNAKYLTHFHLQIYGQRYDFISLIILK